MREFMKKMILENYALDVFMVIWKEKRKTKWRRPEMVFIELQDRKGTFSLENIFYDRPRRLVAYFYYKKRIDGILKQKRVEWFRHNENYVQRDEYILTNHREYYKKEAV